VIGAIARIEEKGGDRLIEFANEDLLRTGGHGGALVEPQRTMTGPGRSVWWSTESFFCASSGHVGAGSSRHRLQTGSRPGGFPGLRFRSLRGTPSRRSRTVGDSGHTGELPDEAASY
jgi:hypothetical protein